MGPDLALSSSANASVPTWGKGFDVLMYHRDYANAKAGAPSLAASTCEGDAGRRESESTCGGDGADQEWWSQVFSSAECDPSKPAGPLAGPAYVSSSRHLGGDAAVGAERSKKPAPLQWLDTPIPPRTPLRTDEANPRALGVPARGFESRAASASLQAAEPPGVWGPPGAPARGSSAFLDAQRPTPPPPPAYPAPGAVSAADSYAADPYSGHPATGLWSQASAGYHSSIQADAVARWRQAELNAQRARAEAYAREQEAAALHLQAQAQQAVHAAAQAAKAAADAQALVAKAQASLSVTLTGMGMQGGSVPPSLKHLVDAGALPAAGAQGLLGAGLLSGQAPLPPAGPPGAFTMPPPVDAAPPLSRAARPSLGGPPQEEVEDTRTMREHLQELRSVDHRRVIRVRKIHVLGFQSPGILKAYFEHYGPVESVLVAHSHVRSCYLPSGVKKREVTTRLRPAHLGFVVMQSVEAAAAALADPLCGAVAGAVISVERFEKRSDDDEEHEAEESEDDADSLPAGANSSMS